MNTELVSVVMTAYNAERYLAEAIESVLSQTYPHFELIIVNDGSKDGTQKILDAYTAKDTRIKAISHTNRGVGLSSNVGLEAATGKYIARLDADDAMMPERLERQVKFMQENPDIAMSSCHAYFINAKGKTIGIQRYKGYETRENFHKSYQDNYQIRCSHSGFICLREALLAIGGYKDLRVGADVDMFTRMAEAGYVLVVPEEILLKFRMHGTSIMAKTDYEALVIRAWIADAAMRRRTGLPEISVNQYKEILDKESSWKKFNRKRVAYAFHYYKIATTAYANGQYHLTIYFMILAGFLSPYLIFKKVYNLFANVFRSRKK